MKSFPIFPACVALPVLVVFFVGAPEAAALPDIVSARSLPGASSLTAPTVTDDDWVTYGTPIGFDGDVEVVYVDPGGEVYVGGFFRVIGDGIYNGIARWDGEAWHPLGDGITSLGSSAVNVITPDGHGGLYVGGSFREMGGVPSTSFIAHWDGENWSALGEGLNGAVFALHRADSGTLYAGGVFQFTGALQVNRVAAWDGSSWSPLGEGLNAPVEDLATGPGGAVFAVGRFTDAGGDEDADFVARWNGVAWAPLGRPALVAQRINAIRIIPGQSITIGGIFTDATGDPAADGVLRWNGSAWEPLGGGLGGEVNDLAVSPEGDLVAIGNFRVAGDPTFAGVARWDGSAWSREAPGMNFVPYLAGAYDTAGTLWLGGRFTQAVTGEAIFANNLVLWDGSELQPPPPGTGSGLGSTIVATAVDNVGRVYVAGFFQNANGDPDQDYIAMWDGSQWQALGSGLNSFVFSLATSADGQIYAGGTFTEAGGHPQADFVARWDGSAWQPLMPEGVAPVLTSGQIEVVATGPDALYIGGLFSHGGGLAGGENIICWDGVGWSALGNGLNGGVRAIVVAPDGTVYAGGSFTDAGGDPDADGLARWDGTAWSAVGGPFQPFVSALTLDHDGNLYAAGLFAGAAPNEALRNIGRWDGTTWSPLPPGLSTWAEALTVDNEGNLYAGGPFFRFNGAQWLSVWDGEAWSSLGRGVNNWVNALAFDPTTERLYVGGDFGLAGGKPTGYFAHLELGDGGPPYLFGNATILGDGWRRLPWFGDFNDLVYPWIYHAEHGFLWTFDLSTLNSLYFYGVGGMGIVWTTQEIYPDVYFFEGGHGWTFYQGVVDGERLFTRYSDGEPFTLPLAPLN